MGSPGNRANKEKKVFISLVGSRGLGCRWVPGTPLGLIVAADTSRPSFLSFLTAAPEDLCSLEIYLLEDPSWCLIFPLNFTIAGEAQRGSSNRFHFIDEEIEAQGFPWMGTQVTVKRSRPAGHLCDSSLVTDNLVGFLER